MSLFSLLLLKPFATLADAVVVVVGGGGVVAAAAAAAVVLVLAIVTYVFNLKKLGLSELGLPLCQEWRNGPLKLASALRKRRTRKIMSGLGLEMGENFHNLIQFILKTIYLIRSGCHHC